MAPDVITIVNYLEHGKPAPSYSHYKGIVTTASIVGYKEYTKRAASKVLSKEALDAKQDHDSYFGYTTRFGAQKTFSSHGWLDTKEKNEKFKNEIATSFHSAGDIIWQPVISLKDFATSTEFKLFNEENYAAVISKVLPKWFERSGFVNSNMNWWMDYHVNTDNPHIHLNFFEIEKTEKSEKKKLPMKQINDFKGMFWNEVFEKKRYLEETGKSVEQGFKNKDILKKETYQSFKKNLQRCTSQEFMTSLKTLYKKLPLSGRLQYNSSHMIPYRQEIDAIVEQLLKMPEVAEKHEEFLASIKEFDKVRSDSLHTEFGSFYKQENKKLHTLLANEVLHEFKNANQNFWNRTASATVSDELQEIKNTVIQPQSTAENKTYFLPVAASLMFDEAGDMIFTRIPKTHMTDCRGPSMFIKLDRNQTILISEQKGFRVAEIQESQKFIVYTKDYQEIGKVLSAKELFKYFDDGGNYLKSLEQAKLWQLQKKDWAEHHADWNQHSSNLQRASFSWMNQIEHEVDQARNEFLYGKEMDLS